MAVWKKDGAGQDLTVVPRFTRAGMLRVPKDRLPESEMLPQTAYQIVLDEVMLDGKPVTFRGTSTICASRGVSVIAKRLIGGRG